MAVGCKKWLAWSAEVFKLEAGTEVLNIISFHDDDCIISLSATFLFIRKNIEKPSETEFHVQFQM